MVMVGLYHAILIYTLVHVSNLQRNWVPGPPDPYDPLDPLYLPLEDDEVPPFPSALLRSARVTRHDANRPMVRTMGPGLMEPSLWHGLLEAETTCNKHLISVHH